MLRHFCLLLGFSFGQCLGCLFTVDGSAFFGEPPPAAAAELPMTAAAWFAAGDTWFDWWQPAGFALAVAAGAFGGSGVRQSPSP
jgi:hypothetical protein